MTPYDFQVLLDSLSLQHPVGPSPRIEDAVELEVGETLTSVQWNEAAELIELTVSLPVLIDQADTPEAQRLLYRALLERQWLQMGGDEGVGFGLLPDSDEVVGMCSLDGDALTGPDSFMATLQQAVLSVLGEWYGICGQILLQQTAATAAPPDLLAAQPPSPFMSA